MTTSPVVSVTDELINQLSALTYIDQGGAVLIHSDQVRALLAERAELKRDADRYRWLRVQNAKSPEECSEINDFAVAIDGPDGGAWVGSDLDATIDAAMKS